MHGATPKYMIGRKNARFDAKMPFPACISWHCHYQTPPSPLLKKNFQIYTDILFLNASTRMDAKWHEYWNISNVIIKCEIWLIFYLDVWYRHKCVLQSPHISVIVTILDIFISSVKIWHRHDLTQHVVNVSTMHSTKTFATRVSNNIAFQVSPHLRWGLRHTQSI